MSIRVKFFLIGILLCTSQYGGSQTPASLFFSPPDMLSAALSPSGDHIGAIRQVGDTKHLVLIDTSNEQHTLLLDTYAYSKEGTSIEHIAWLDTRYIAVQMSEKRSGIEDLLSRKVSRRLLVVDTQAKNEEDKVKSVRTPGWLANALPREKGHFLYAKSGIYSKVYKLNIARLINDKKKLGKLDKVDGGQFKKSNEVAAVKGHATRWYFDATGYPAAVLHYAETDVLSLSEILADGEYNAIKTWSEKSDKKKGKRKQKAKAIEPKGKNYFVPVAFTNQAHTFLCLDNNEKYRRSVYKVNFVTNTHTLIYETSAYEIVSLIFSPNNTFQGVKVFKDGIEMYEYIDDNPKGRTQRRHQGTRLVSTFDVSVSGEHTLSYWESHDKPGRYIFRKPQQDKTFVVGHTFPQLDNKLQSRLIDGHIEVDSLTIPYLLTLPQSVSQAPYPLIVMPHGGPIGTFDDRYYNADVQYWAANGYAVLRVNFRGSSGYNTALLEAGKRQWGGKMLSDIILATQKVVARKDIDAKHVCAVGYSYGGYAAAMLLLKRPKIFKCGVASSGVYDVNLYVSSARLSDKQRKWAKEYIGDSNNEYEKLKAISPVYLVDSLERPLLVAHGAKDKVVDVEHAYRLSLMLKKYNKAFEFYIDEEGEHHFGDPEKTSLLFEKMAAFVAKHI